MDDKLIIFLLSIPRLQLAEQPIFVNVL